MSTLAEWAALYDEWRARYPWLPEATFEAMTVNFGAYFVGPNKFFVRLDQPANRNVIAHEAGHCAHLTAAVARDRAEGRGTAGDDIIREIQQIVAPGRDWLEPPDPGRSEYVAEAFRKANTGLTGPMGFPNPPGERSPYPVNELLAYFRTTAEPRTVPAGGQVAPVVPEPPAGADLSTHWYSQFGTDSVSQGDCVPACIKTMLSLYQREVPTIGFIRGILGVPSGGVDLVTMRAGLADLGIQGVVVSSRDVPFDDVLAHVRENKPCVVFILYADITNRVDPFGGLHAVVLTSVNGNVGIVLDPDNARDIPAHYALDDLRRAWDNGRTVGGGAFIPDEEVGGDMAEYVSKAEFDAYKANVLSSFTAHVDAIGRLSDRIKALEADEAADDATVAALRTQLDTLRATLRAV